MNDRILIVQLGQTGLSLARHFLARGSQVTIVDERERPPQLAQLTAELPGQKVERIESYSMLAKLADQHDEVYVSPGVAPHFLPAGMRAKGDLERFLNLFWERWPNGRRPKLVAVTGTNGKSTVAKLTSELLGNGSENAEAVGNIGVPLLDAWSRWEADGFPNFIIMELSSFQLARQKHPLRADVACMVNCTSDHLDWHATVANYRDAKRKVYSSAAVGVFNRSESDGLDLVDQVERKVGFGGRDIRIMHEWNIRDGQIEFGGQANLRLSTTGLLAAGIIPESACAALTLAREAAHWQDMTGHLGDLGMLHGLAHRFEHVATKGSIAFVNDSKATNVSATVQALSSLAHPCVLIAGGQAKGQDFVELAEKAKDRVAHAILLGEAAGELEQAFGAAGVATTQVASMAEAVASAYAQAQNENVGHVMLSPACSSLDQYADYIKRGEDFAGACQEIGEQNAIA